MGEGKSNMEIYQSINGISAEEVLKITSEYPHLFIRYFEAVIDNDGLVYFGCPSHERKVLELAEKQFGVTEQMCYEQDWSGLDLVDNYGYVLTWYHNIAGTPNQAQKITLDKLRDYGLLEKEHKSSERMLNVIGY